MNGAEFLSFVALLWAGHWSGYVRGQGATSSISINEGGFSCDGPSGNLLCSGNASTTAQGLLKLTPDPAGRTKNYTYYTSTFGVAMYNDPVQVVNRTNNRAASFNVNFSFLIESGEIDGVKLNGRGSGLAFVMFANKTWVGYSGPYLGAFARSGKAGVQTLAVEFDTTISPDVLDHDDNHVGIDITSIISEEAKKVPFDLADQRVYAWIDYDASTSTLEIRVSQTSKKPEQAILSHNRDLVEVFTVTENVWVGFSGSNGRRNSFGFHRVFNLSFQSSFVSLLPPPSPTPGNNSNSTVSTSLIAGVAVGGSVVIIIGVCLLVFCVRQRRRIDSQDGNPGNGTMAVEEFQTAGLSTSSVQHDGSIFSTHIL